jgi:hypothetical protein
LTTNRHGGTLADSDRAFPHALYGEFNGVFDVTTLEMTEGDMPLRAQQLVTLQR